MDAYFLPMEPNNLLCQLWKWKHADVSRHTGGDLAAALGRITARTTVMPIETDQLVPPALVSAEAKRVPGAHCEVIRDQCGHLGLFATEPEYLPQVDAN